jgi:hypothetical protein
MGATAAPAEKSVGNGVLFGISLMRYCWSCLIAEYTAFGL